MLRKIYRSIRFRAAYAYRQRMLRRYQPQVLAYTNLSAPNDRGDAPFEVLSIAGRKQLDLLRYSFWSMGCWYDLPRLHLVSDGTLEVDELLKAMAWWPKPVRAERWEAIADRLVARGRTALRDLAQSNMLARKACAIFDAAEHGPTLFCDTDLLWFAGPPALPGADEGPAIKMATDLTPCYDADLLRDTGAEPFLDPPFLNSGLCYVRGDIYAAAGIDQVIDYAVAHPQYFTEQTLLAYACKKLGGDCFGADQILLKTDDATAWRFDYSWLRHVYARHYVGEVRHWFWRDALMRLRGSERFGFNLARTK